MVTAQPALSMTIYDETGDLYPKSIKVVSPFNTSYLNSGAATQTYKGDVSPASVVNGSFVLPVWLASKSFSWYAIE